MRSLKTRLHWKHYDFGEMLNQNAIRISSRPWKEKSEDFWIFITKSLILKKIWQNFWKTTTPFRLFPVAVWFSPPLSSEKLETSIGSLLPERCLNTPVVLQENAPVARKLVMLNHEVATDDWTVLFTEWHSRRYHAWATKKQEHISEERYLKANQRAKLSFVSVDRW